MKPTIIALYLPQYHETPYNNAWWGKGYTEWTACKQATALFDGHYQPRVPLTGYYDLSKIETMKQQAITAKKYGIDAFAIYHYYFMGKKLLEKPTEMLLQHKEIHIDFCLFWANHDWKKSWFGHNNEMLQKQEYGKEKDWLAHFNYCLQFFKDDRYIKIEDKPVFFIFNTGDIPDLNGYIECWDQEAKNHGFKGVFFVKTLLGARIDTNLGKCSAVYEREPNFTLAYKNDRLKYLTSRANLYTKAQINRLLRNFSIPKGLVAWRVNYEDVWQSNINRSVQYENTFLGAFTDWDNSPRKGYDSVVMDGPLPILFENYFQKLYEKSKKMKYPVIVINAWNEWAEGAYLEPDIRFKYSYLRGIKSVVDKNKPAST